ncbi:MAG: sigma-70 family RNA polymerase sigma factor [Solirubrobacteraceae bacterium]
MQIDEERLFEKHFRGYAGRVHAFALRRADPEAAQDVTAETFLIAWRRRAEMPPEPLPWLYGIARGVLANERRTSNRQLSLTARIAAEPAASGAAAAAAGDHEILQALASLRESDREALLLSAWEGLSSREAAAVVGCTAATFAVRLHRARKRLARALGAPSAEADPGADLVRPNNSVPEVSR